MSSVLYFVSYSYQSLNKIARLTPCDVAYNDVSNIVHNKGLMFGGPKVFRTNICRIIGNLGKIRTVG